MTCKNKLRPGGSCGCFLGTTGSMNLGVISTQSDSASVLDDAAKYLRALKLQAETMMSMSYNVPTAVQQRQFPAFPRFPPLGLGVCYPAASPGVVLMPTSAQTQLQLISPQILDPPQAPSFSNSLSHGGNST